MSALKSIAPETPENGAPIGSADPSAISAAQVARDARRERARRLGRAVTLWVLGPTLLAAVYFFGIARDQYESVSTLIVRGRAAGNYGVIVREYLQSRDALAQLDHTQDFSKHYADFGDPVFDMTSSAGSETRYESYRNFVSVRFDAGSGLLTLKVRAFSPKKAQQFALASLDDARRFLKTIDADGEHGLTAVSRPSLPNEASYPHRGYGVLAAFLVSLAVFIIGSLLIMAAREHGQF